MALRLALKAIVELARGNLDRDGPAEARVGAEVHLAHAALADHRHDLVVTELFAGGKLVNAAKCLTDKLDLAGC